MEKWIDTLAKRHVISPFNESELRSNMKHFHFLTFDQSYLRTVCCESARTSLFEVLAFETPSKSAI